MKAKKYTAICTLALILKLGHVFPQAGTLDLSFGIDGKVTTDIDTLDDVLTSMAIQSDGKIVSVGYSTFIKNYLPHYGISVTRHNPNGSLDMTFGTNGKLTTSVNEFNSVGYAIAIQQDEKIVVAGYASKSKYDNDNEIILVRYNTNGTLDPTFDGDGIVMTTINETDYVHGLVIQDDGKILITGNTFATDSETDEYGIIIVRYNSDGSLDPKFSDDGKVFASIYGFEETGNSIATLSDGRIVVAGYTDRGFEDYESAVLCFNTDGSPDTTFGTDGKVTGSVYGIDDIAYDVAIQSDDKIVITGHSQSPSGPYEVAVMRYNTDGSLDSTFDSDGMATASFNGSNAEGFSVAIQQDGKIVVTGCTDKNYKLNIALVRFNTDGSLDASFDSDGKLYTLIGVYTVGVAVEMQSDGKIVVAGYTTSNNDEPIGFCLAQYDAGLTGIQDNLSDFSVNVFPNPVSDYVTISSDAFTSREETTIAIKDAIGKIVFKKSYIVFPGEGITLNVAYLTTGMYFLEVNNNKQVFSKKIIKE